MERLRIAVTGLAATYPFGGVFWDYAQYLLGFLRLGHDVLYIEDTGKWCYDPAAATFVEKGAGNAALLARSLEALDPDLRDRWFFRDATGDTFGRPWAEVSEFCRSADLFLHVSLSCWMRDEYFAAGTVAFVDSDPMYSQTIDPHYLAEHDLFFTFAENIQGPDCLVPRDAFHWIPTRQPVVLDCFEPYRVPLSERRRVLTTVASWEPAEGGPTVEGRTYGGKSREFEKFMKLPSLSPLPLELAMSGPAPRGRLAEEGWSVLEARTVSGDPWIYRDYLANSFAEWSVAKNAYVESRSGWFSCRTACYLALGVPGIVQDTGFQCAIPAGEGVLAFRTPEEAAAAIEQVAEEPARHSAAAVEIAREYFDSARVLTHLLEVVGAGSRPAHRPAEVLT
jgi:hypothetical protein